MSHIKLFIKHRYFEKNQIMLLHHLRPSGFNLLNIAGCTDTNHTLSLDDAGSPVNVSLKSWLKTKDNINFPHENKQNMMKLDITE